MHFLYIIPYSKLPRQKLTAPQLVMKFPAFLKPDNLLPCLHHPTDFAYPKTHVSIPCLQKPLASDTLLYFIPIYT
jgi:hypothetical protein